MFKNQKLNLIIIYVDKKEGIQWIQHGIVDNNIYYKHSTFL